MRKLLITSRLLLMSFVATASQQSSQLLITNDQNGPFSVSIDHSSFSVPGKVYRADCIEPGYHYIKIVRTSFRKHANELLFSNYIYIPSATKIIASIDCNRRFNIASISPVLSVQNPNFNNNHLFTCGNSNVLMSQVDFDQLKCSITSKNFDSSRLQIAKQALSTNYFTSRQISELMQLMTFESSRLELARTGYANTLDKQNYYIVYDAFTFESSIDDLNRFIQTN